MRGSPAGRGRCARSSCHLQKGAATNGFVNAIWQARQAQAARARMLCLSAALRFSRQEQTLAVWAERSAAPTCARLQNLNTSCARAKEEQHEEMQHADSSSPHLRAPPACQCAPPPAAGPPHQALQTGVQGRGDITITNSMAFGGSKLHRSTSQPCNASAQAACLHCATCRTARSAPLGSSGRRLAAPLPAAPHTPRQSRLQ